METHVLGFPRIGAARELKFALERYWRGDLTATALKANGRELKLRHWAHQHEAGLSLVTVGDFSFYDQVLDMALMLSLVPPRFAPWQEDNALDLAFRMARGDAASNTPALDMTKWFDTNYHYIVPELSPGMAAQLREDVVSELLEDADLARAHGLHTKAVLLGPITFMTLCRPIAGLDRWSLLPGVLSAYADLVRRLAVRCKWIQLDEPVLCTDMTSDAQAFFLTSCKELRRAAGDCPVLLTTYFGELGENLNLALGSGCAALHLDGVRARQEIDAVVDRLPQGMCLSLGLVDGRNIWKTDLVQARTLAARAVHTLGQDRVMLGSSCSLLHCPVDVTLETALPPEITRWMAFAVQKCQELTLLRKAIEGTAGAALAEHSACLAERRASPLVQDPAVRQRVAAVEPAMLQRTSPVQLRKARQREALGLPLLPTTTIGSFPQTSEIRGARLAHRRGEMSSEAYESFLRESIAQVIARQEALGLDVLVHGESERNDMVEYFGQMLKGFCFTANGWVQSYGSRCVKPPVIVGDVSRPGPMTVTWIVYAQSLTQKPVKGMLTGPVTILNWSFVRDDVPRADVCRQLALAVRDEVQDLERAGVSIIQIDEAAFREGMPLARAAQEAYLSWAVECFRLASAGVHDETQIHTHMCYSEFDTIIPWIAAMDADVISIESSRSSMTLLDVFTEFEFPYDIGPGVYDIHSPRVPAVEEMAALLRKALAVLPADRVWVNPDCGLKTRAWPETMAALANMVAAAHRLRDEVRAQAS